MRTSSSDTNSRVVYLCCPSLCRARALLAALRWRARARDREREREVALGKRQQDEILTVLYSTVTSESALMLPTQRLGIVFLSSSLASFLPDI
ncbi:unnamed protein product [Eretmochelys imbricata]